MSTSLSSYSCLALAILALTSQFGCIALSIPSERMHDPSDHGGLFGDWKPAGDSCADGDCQVGGGGVTGVDHGESRHDPCCIDGGPLDSHPFDPSFDADGQRKAKPEQVPWPRFHPVPTRPVFGVPDNLP